MNTLIILTDIVEKLILLLLLGLSVWSVSIMIDRRRFFKEQNKFDLPKLKEFLRKNRIEEAHKFCQSNNHFIAQALIQALSYKDAVAIDRSVSSFVKAEKKNLEKGLTVLATLGANAPFVGLFGTVLGIIRAFAYLGSQSGSAAVMSGVSQALYATAVGLFVAIPAVVAFNIFSKKVKEQISELESLRDLYVSQIKS
jgi:biopolymer transport protein ExbB/TolQ